ncbi:MAG: GNAT family acetyltransferase [Planctomycetota bacterium]
MSEGIEIRVYAEHDRFQVIELWNDVFECPTGHNDPASSLNRKVAVQDGLFFVALDNGQVIGTTMAGYDGHRGWLYSIAVHPEWRRRGVGSALVRHAEDQLRIKGCPKVNLQVIADNESVVGFYQTLGFSVEPRVSLGKRL